MIKDMYKLYYNNEECCTLVVEIEDGPNYYCPWYKAEVEFKNHFGYELPKNIKVAYDG